MLEKIVNYFQPVKPETIIATGMRPGNIIPIKSLNDKIITLPCPLSIQLTHVCICMSCDFVSKLCPMEILCRNSGCETAFVKGCTNYKNKEDMDEEKRRVFKDGTSFGGTIFYFTSGKLKKDN